MKVAPVKTNEEHKPLSRWILATLIILPLVTVGTVRAQEDTDAVRAQVSAQDRASIYSLSNFRFHVLPANTKAGKASAGARTLTAMPESSGSAHPRLTITDPDPPTGWVANSSLDEQGFEIGDECQPIGNQNFQSLTPTFLLNGKKYELQLEYSNEFHGCANVP